MVLDDLTVIDCCWLLPGQFVAMVLGDLGARVIKIEMPETGDYARQMGGEGFATVNRGKEGLTLNLRIPAAQEVMHRLVNRSDVLLEGFRPGVMARLGASYETLAAIQPSLLYCSLSGFGQTGPHRDRPGHGLNYAAIAGLQHMAGDSESLAPIIGDLAGSLFAAIAVLAAVRERDRHGTGQYIDMSITDAVYGLLTESLAGGHRGTGRRQGTFGVFTAADDRLITIGAVEDHFFAALARAIGCPQWLDDPRYATYDARRINGHELRPHVESAVRSRTSSEWLAAFAEAGVPSSLVNDLSEATYDAHAEARQLVTRIDQPGIGQVAQVRFPALFSSLDYRRSAPAPSVGEHTHAILDELGFTQSEIESLRSAGAI